MTKMQQSCRFLRIVFQVALVLIPLFTAFYWIYYKSLTHAGIQSDLPIIDSEIVTNASTRYMAFLVSLLPMGVIMYSIHHIILLLKSIESGHLFSKQNPKRMIKIGFTLLVLVGIGIVYDALISYVITFHNPPGHHVVAVSFGMNDFNALVMSCVIIIGGWLLREATQKIEPDIS